MHVLIIPSERYLPADNPLEGIFQRDQAHVLKRAGFNVGVVSPQLRSIRLLGRGGAHWPKGYEVENDLGIPVWSYHGWGWIPYLQQGKRWLWIKAGMALFQRYLSERGRPEVIHAHNAQWAGMLASRIKKVWKIPYVLTEHSSAYSRHRVQRSEIPEIKEVFRNADCRLVVSPKLGILLEKSLGESACPWEWVPNVLGDIFEQETWMPPFGEVDHRPFLFLNVGALIEVKGQDQLLTAFAGAFRGKSDVRLRIGGDGPLRARLETHANRLGIADQVTFLGGLMRQEVLVEMQQCDVYVHSSRYETFGVTLIEALSCGKPVISSACGGPECIVQESNGILVPPNNMMALGRAMIQIMKEIWKYKVASIRKDCLSRFGQSVLAERLSSIYERVRRRNHDCEGGKK